MKVGCRVNTEYGCGEIVGIEFKGESHQRYIVALDFPDNWVFGLSHGHPHFFKREISEIKNTGYLND